MIELSFMLFMFCLVIVVSLCVEQFAKRDELKYSFDEKNIKIKWLLFGVIPKKINVDYSEIVEIREIKNFGIIFNASVLYLKNRIWGKRVLIKRSGKHLFKIIIITPDDADDFIRQVNDRINGEKLKSDR